MQAVEITGMILQKQRRWAFLAGAMTARDEVRKLLRISDLVPEPFGPLVGKRRKLRVDRSPEMLHDLGQRIIEILILAAAERIARHFNSRAKAAVVGVIAGDLAATILCEHGGEKSGTAVLDMRKYFFPNSFLLSILRPR